jgi:uncharacterized membrane protein YesL
MRRMDTNITRPPSVRIAFRTLGRTLRHCYENLFTVGIAGVLWLLCTVPVLFIVLFLVLALPITGFGFFLLLLGSLLVGIGPPSAALHRIVQPMSEERASSWRVFWQYFRADARWSLSLVGTLLLVLLVAELNRSFYSQSLNTNLYLLTGFFLVIILVWLAMMLYAIPMALRQTEPSLRITLRNTAILTLANLPGAAVSVVLLFVTSLILAAIPPLFLLLPGWIALWSEENVRLLLVASGHIPPDEFADRER